MKELRRTTSIHNIVKRSSIIGNIKHHTCYRNKDRLRYSRRQKDLIKVWFSRTNRCPDSFGRRSRHQHPDLNHTKVHWAAVKRFLKYLTVIISHRLLYTKAEEKAADYVRTERTASKINFLFGPENLDLGSAIKILIYWYSVIWIMPQKRLSKLRENKSSWNGWRMIQGIT